MPWLKQRAVGLLGVTDSMLTRLKDLLWNEFVEFRPQKLETRKEL